jgi:hypothetical protein
MSGNNWQVHIANGSYNWIAPTLDHSVLQGPRKLLLQVHARHLIPCRWLGLLGQCCPGSQRGCRGGPADSRNKRHEIHLTLRRLHSRADFEPPYCVPVSWCQLSAPLPAVAAPGDPAGWHRKRRGTCECGAPSHSQPVRDCLRRRGPIAATGPRACRGPDPSRTMKSPT